jgi:hypothetical protein
MAIRKVLGEAADALRRLFGAPVVRSLAAPVPSAIGHGGPLLRADARGQLDPLVIHPESLPLFTGAAGTATLEPFSTELCVEEGWARWSTEARVQIPSLFPPGGAAGGSVPSLPQGRAQRLPVPAVAQPAVRMAPPAVGKPRAFRIPIQGFDLELEKGLGPVMRKPFSFPSQNVLKLPKSLWMRYSLALVKATGENVRNLEVLGLWQLPRKGVSGLRPDAEGRLWVQLSPEASGAPRAAFMVARKKDDQSLISAFVE